MGLVGSFDAPASDEFEVTIIGTGGGYGETILCHVGDKSWIVVDSCQDPVSDEVLAIDYFKKIGVDLTSSVKLVVCTHWDDDHIRGISRVLEESKNAGFVISSVNDHAKFLQLVSLDFEKLEKRGSKSSTREFMSCLTIVSKRKATIMRAMQDRTLYSSLVKGAKVEVISLSPSDESIKLFDSEISRLITAYGPPSKKLIQSPNEKSVVLLLKLDNHRALLGADLETTENNKTGWDCILANSTTTDKESSYFKISHHGSVTGYHPDIWSKLLEKEPFATLTPWNRNKKLPQEEMVKKYKGHTSNLYITSFGTSSKPKDRGPEMNKLIDRLEVKVSEEKFLSGVIRARIRPSETQWRIQLFDKAVRL